MKKKLVVLAVVAALMLIGATLAFGGPGRLIYDDGAYVKPGSLDDGKDLRPRRRSRSSRRSRRPGTQHPAR